MQSVLETPLSTHPAAQAGNKPRKQLIRRLLKDRSQSIRRTVQFLFLALNAWIAVEFVQWFASSRAKAARISWNAPQGSTVGFRSPG